MIIQYCEICQCDPCDCHDFFIKVRKERYNKISLTLNHIIDINF